MAKTLTTSWQNIASYSYVPGTGFRATFYLDARYTSQSIQNNNSHIEVRLNSGVQAGSGSGYNYGFGASYCPTVSGSSRWTIENETITSGSGDVAHNTDGTKTVRINASGYINGLGMSFNIGEDCILPTIPRYANPSQSVNTKTETSITMNWTADATCDYIWYSKDNGSNWTAVGSVNASSGSYTIPNLTANTSYNIKTRVRRKDSQLNKDTSALAVTTYPYPYVSSTPNFTIGNNVTITLYNPLNRTVELQMWSYVGSCFINSTRISTNVNGNYTFPASNYISQLYASIPNVKTSQYNIEVWYGDNKAIKAGGNYTIRGNENPTFGVGNIIDVVDTLNVAITGDNTKFIKGHNTLTGVITPMSSNYGANLDYYSVSASGLATVIKTYSESNQSFTLGNMVSNTFNVTAIDKRGMSRTAKIDIDLVAYNNPGVTIAKITRQNGIDTKAVLNFTGVYTDWTGLLKTNSIQSIRYRIGVNGTWKSLPSDATLTSSGGVWTLNTVLNDDFATTSQYDLYLEITDLLETVIVGVYTISTADAFIWKDLANKRMGIDKKPNKTLDVAGDINADNALYINGVKMIWYE